MQTPPRCEREEEAAGRLPLFYPMIYSNQDLEAIIQVLFERAAEVVADDMRVVPTCHALSYTNDDDGLRKFVGRIRGSYEQIRSTDDVESIMAGSRKFLRGGHAQGVLTETAIVLLDGEQDLLPLGDFMPRGEHVVAYVAHARQAPQVVYAPILRTKGRAPRLGAACQLAAVPPSDFPDIIPIELYGQVAGEA